MKCELIGMRIGLNNMPEGLFICGQAIEVKSGQKTNIFQKPVKFEVPISRTMFNLLVANGTEKGLKITIETIE